jgi:hypothetical protein
VRRDILQSDLNERCARDWIAAAVVSSSDELDVFRSGFALVRGLVLEVGNPQYLYLSMGKIVFNG